MQIVPCRGGWLATAGSWYSCLAPRSDVKPWGLEGVIRPEISAMRSRCRFRSLTGNVGGCCALSVRSVSPSHTHGSCKRSAGQTPRTGSAWVRQPPSHPRLDVCRAQDSTGAGRLAQNGESNGFAHFVAALYRFSRPHTMLGTFVSVISVSLLALQGSPVTVYVLQGMVTALVPALLMNICIVGMNQVYDVEIDKINKPYLPLASGELNMPTGIWIVVSTGLLALIMGAISGSAALMCTLAGSLALGIVYSCDLPLLRWKKYPVLAAACVLSVRAVAVQLGFFLHILHYTPLAAGAEGLHSAAFVKLLQGPLGFTMGFMLLFSIVIALFKDIPDTKGDIQANVRTLSVRLGVNRVFWICIGILELAYLCAMAYGAMRPLLWSKVVVVAGHGLMGWLLLKQAKSVDLQSNSSITDCYMFIWKLFYAEYLLIPLFR